LGDAEKIGVEAMYELFNEPVAWLMILLTMATVMTVKYWSTPLTSVIESKLRLNANHAAKLQTMFEHLGRTLQTFDDKIQKQIGAVDTKLGLLTRDVGSISRDAHEIEAHLVKLEVKTGVAETKLSTMQHQVDVDAGALKRIEDQIKNNSGAVENNTRQIDYLEHEVHDLEMLQIDDKIETNTGRVKNNARQIQHIEYEVKSLLRNELKGLRNELRGLEHNGHYENGSYESRRRAIHELENADRRIEKLMDDTIQFEASYQGHPAWQSNGSPSAQEHEEHHSKLIDAAQHIFRDIKKYLTRNAVQDMEVEAEQVNWSRGELFANPSSPEAVRAYHLQVKDYFIKLKDAIARTLHEITADTHRTDH
jgi:hypothetical protein